MQESLFSRRSSEPPAIEPVQGVSRVVDYIKRIIEGNKTLAGIRVRGEVTELRERNGRLYFSLKENADTLRCMVWANAAAKLPPFKNGDEIICGGTFSAYTPQSFYELIVTTVEQTGIGALYAQFEALKEQFRKEGLFEESRKQPLPAFPRRIAVVSAEGGKGVEDFFTVIRREAPFITIVQIDTRVQGDGAEIDIAEAIDKASKRDVDLIVVTRGGGSYEDLFPFNREPVVRAIVRAKKPVITAVGHTADMHLADYAADRYFETPSNAANFLAEIGKRFERRIADALSRITHAARSLFTARAQSFDYAASRLGNAIQNSVRERERTLHALERRLNAQPPHARLAERGRRVAALGSRLDRLRDTAVPRFQERLIRLTTRLNGLDPHTLLARGYAIVTVDGHAVTDAADVAQGALIEAQLQRGKLHARVERKELES